MCILNTIFISNIFTLIKAPGNKTRTKPLITNFLAWTRGRETALFLSVGVLKQEYIDLKSVLNWIWNSL